MHLSSLSRITLCFAASVALCTPAADAQVCLDPGDTFWKNDVLDDAPRARGG